jgi:outer membrane protein OmpA-like peptidoglycan-associated protein
MSNQESGSAKAFETQEQSESQHARQRAESEVARFEISVKEQTTRLATVKEFMARNKEREAGEAMKDGNVGQAIDLEADAQDLFLDAADLRQQLGDSQAADDNASQVKRLEEKERQVTHPRELRPPPASSQELAQDGDTVAADSATETQRKPSGQESTRNADSGQDVRRRLTTGRRQSPSSQEPIKQEDNLAVDSTVEAKSKLTVQEAIRRIAYKPAQEAEQRGTTSPADRTHAKALSQAGDRQDELMRRKDGLDTQRESQERLERHLLQDRPHRLGDQPDDRMNFAIVFADGNYGRAAEAYLRTGYSEYTLLRANSIEDADAKMADMLRGHRADSGSEPKIRNIIMVTHANEYGVLKIPLTEQDAQSGTAKETVHPFSAWNLANLLGEIKQGKRQTLVEDRSEVLQALDRESLVTVAGCNFGRSKDGLQALHAFYGGQAEVYAPVGLQVFEMQPMGIGHVLQSRLEAFNFLLQQDRLPPETRQLDNKQQLALVDGVIRRSGGFLPTQSFIIGDNNQEEFRQLNNRQQLSAQAEHLKTRPALPDPVLRHELARLSPKELAAVAHNLEQGDRPGKSLVVWAARNAWYEKSREEMQEAGFADSNDPIAGLPPFGGSLMVDPDLKDYTLEDPWRSSRQAGVEPETPGSDPFLEGRFSMDAPTNRDVAEHEFNQELLEQAAKPPSLERPYSSKGFVEPIQDGVRLWNFAIGRADLRSDFEAPLRNLAQQMRANPDLTMTVTGHASTPGGQAANDRVALARALVIANFLGQNGVSADKILLLGAGEHNPLEADTRGGKVNAEHAAHNRRVEVRLVPNGQNSAAMKEASQVALAAIADQSQPLTEAVKDAQEEVDDTLHKGLEVSSLVLHTVAEIIEVETIGLVAPLLEWVGIAQGYSDAREAHRREGVITGIKLGLSAAKMSPEQLGKDIYAQDLGAVIRNDKWLQYFWDEEKRNNPVNDYRELGMIEGVARVVDTINQTNRKLESSYRRILQDRGFPASQVDRIYRENIQGIRLQALDLIDKNIRDQISRLEKPE